MTGRRGRGRGKAHRGPDNDSNPGSALDSGPCSKRPAPDTDPTAAAAAAVVGAPVTAPRTLAAALRYVMAIHDLLDWAPPELVPRREHIAGFRRRPRGSGRGTA